MDSSAVLKANRLLFSERLLPPSLPRMPPVQDQAPSGVYRGHIALFTGCVSRHLERATHLAAAQLLSMLGFEVSVPKQPSCCGALYRHEGFPEAADSELSNSAEIFDDEAFDAVLVTASACAGELGRAAQLKGKATELTRFLADLDWPDSLRFVDSRLSVAVHVPCTQSNLLGDPNAAFDLLKRLPGLVVSPLPDNATCCGAAGAFVLREPELSQELIKDKINRVRHLPDVVVTTNTGCSLQLAAGFRDDLESPVRVLHPVQLLLERLTSADDTL